MQNPVESIIRQSFNNQQKYNVLTFPTHERTETNICHTGHSFYAYRGQGIKDWNTTYAPVPKNYVLLDPNKGEHQLPFHVTFDLILSQNVYAHFQIAQQLSQKLGIPHIRLEHTLPPPNWSPHQLAEMNKARGTVNVFISEYSLGQWKWENRGDTTVVHHMVDSDLFRPAPWICDKMGGPPGVQEQEIDIELMGMRKNHILSVNNDWINRDWCINFKGWQRITKDLPVRVVGDTPGLSKPAKDTDELISEYQNSRIFISTATISPIPTVLLEAMSCGCACVSTATCMVPSIIQHGYDGLISNDEKELREYCQLLLNDVKLATELGKNARQTIKEKFGKERFLNQWNQIFNEVAG